MSGWHPQRRHHHGGKVGLERLPSLFLCFFQLQEQYALYCFLELNLILSQPSISQSRALWRNPWSVHTVFTGCCRTWHCYRLPSSIYGVKGPRPWHAPQHYAATAFRNRTHPIPFYYEVGLEHVSHLFAYAILEKECCLVCHRCRLETPGSVDESTSSLQKKIKQLSKQLQVCWVTYDVFCLD